MVPPETINNYYSRTASRGVREIIVLCIYIYMYIYICHAPPPRSAAAPATR